MKKIEQVKRNAPVADRRNVQLAAKLAKSPQARLEERSADTIENHVDALAAVELASGIHHVFVIVGRIGENEMIDAGIPLALGRERGTVHADGVSAFPFGDLRYGATDTAGRSRSEERFAGAEVSGVNQPNPGSHKICAHSGGFFKGKIFGLEGHTSGGDNKEFGVGAVACEADIAASAPDLAAEPFPGAANDHA